MKRLEDAWMCCWVFAFLCVDWVIEKISERSLMS